MTFWWPYGDGIMQYPVRFYQSQTSKAYQPLLIRNYRDIVYCDTNYMRTLPFIVIYSIFILLWCAAYYQFIAPVKDTQLILLLLAGSLFYSLIWGLFISLFQRMLGWKGYGMLLIPVAIMIVFFLGMDRSTFLFMLGLIAISELVSIIRIFSNNRKNGK